jgi:hypothetical protein
MEYTQSVWSEGIEERRRILDSDPVEAESLRVVIQAIEAAPGALERVGMVITKAGKLVGAPDDLISPAMFVLSRWEDSDLAEKDGVLSLSEVIFQKIAEVTMNAIINDGGGDDYRPGNYL